MDAHPEVGFTFGNYIELGEDGTETPVRRFAERTNKLDQSILPGLEFIELSGGSCLVATCSAVVRTELQKRLGGYRAELPHAGDMEMWLRFAANASVGFIKPFQGVYRRHNVNMSSSYYTTGARLAELRQRKAAIDCFFETCGDLLPNARRLRWKLYQSLGERTIFYASVAFNESEIEASTQLAEFAVGVCPQLYISSEWIKFALKRRMGPRAWRALRPAVAAIRRLQPNQ